MIQVFLKMQLIIVPSEFTKQVFIKTAETHKLQVTGMDSRLFDTDGTTELLSGSAVNVFDKLFTNGGAQAAGYADSVIVSGQVNMHASHSFTVTTGP